MKSPEKTPAPGELVPQPHGGALKHGSTEGGPPGPGRPPSAIREQLRGSLVERIKILEAIADDPDSSASDRIKAIDMLAKYGLGTRQEVTGPDGEALFKVYRNIDDEDV
jgi:hypothetical protein